jgi:5'-nucleotidase
MSNVIDNETGRPLADGKITHCLQWGGHKIGLVRYQIFSMLQNLVSDFIFQIGLVEREWLDTLASINTDEVTFIDYVEAGKRLSQQLKQEVICLCKRIGPIMIVWKFKGCEYVIALTHMRTPNDILLVEGVPEIDLFLGGHDHVYDVRQVTYQFSLLLW